MLANPESLPPIAVVMSLVRERVLAHGEAVWCKERERKATRLRRGAGGGEETERNSAEAQNTRICGDKGAKGGEGRQTMSAAQAAQPCGT